MTKEEKFFVHKYSGHYYTENRIPVNGKVLFEGTEKECYEFVKKDIEKMKDEEMAEEQKLCLKAQSFKEDVKAHDIDVINAVENKLDAYKVGRYDGFLAGLKAGRPQWHKVADGDLPKDEGIYLVVWQRTVFDKKYGGKLGFQADYFKKGSFEIVIEDVIAWCEIPTFDKE